jgi:broad specificity phosphatase PhoE
MNGRVFLMADTMFVLRHGEIDESKEDLPLSPLGIEQSHAWGEAMLRKCIKPTIISSPAKRCLETAGFIQSLAGENPILICDELRDWEPEKESFEEMIERGIDAYLFILSHTMLNTIITHGGIIQGIIHYATFKPIEDIDCPRGSGWICVNDQWYHAKAGEW